jgi:hypothetical protein
MRRIRPIIGKGLELIIGGGWNGCVVGLLLDRLLPVTDPNSYILLGLMTGAIVVPLVIALLYVLSPTASGPNEQPPSTRFSLALAKQRINDLSGGEIFTWLLFISTTIIFIGFLYGGRLGVLLAFILSHWIDVRDADPFAVTGAIIGMIATPVVVFFFITTHVPRAQKAS